MTTRTRAAILLLLVQTLLVLSIAGKYWYERRTRPNIWVRATQYDPQQPLRGRYLTLQLVVAACHLPQDKEHFHEYQDGPHGGWSWPVKLTAVNGKLTPVLSSTLRPSDRAELHLSRKIPCDQATVSETIEYFIPEHAVSPFSLKKDHELWVEVTVPAEGLPRPIRLATSGPEGFKPLPL